MHRVRDTAQSVEWSPSMHDTLGSCLEPSILEVEAGRYREFEATLAWKPHDPTPQIYFFFSLENDNFCVYKVHSIVWAEKYLQHKDSMYLIGKNVFVYNKSHTSMVLQNFGP